ncbi:MAG: glucosyl transferase [Ignavibacteriaceae bacterium]|nr:glucosyl transferase [Ignavibacteriaceae bacterium]
MNTKIILPVTLLLLNIVACNTTDPPPDSEKPTLKLKLEDVSCIEAWIRLTTTNLQLPATVIIKQYNSTGDTLSHISILDTQDSLLYIDSLLPNQTYKFHTTIQSYNQAEVKSNELSVTTMDTTSHNFTFETFTFGGTAGSSVLYDVAIINDNYIIAVGNVFLLESIGQPDPQPYGIAIWNGQSWELKKIFHSTNIPVTPRGILVISENEIYLAAGSIFRWDGVSSTVQMVYSRLSLPNPNATIEKLWGESNSQIYGVGNAGSIVFYNGTSWSRIESGTELNINDIWGDYNQKTGDWGDYNQKTGEWEILAVASNKFFNEGKKIFKIDGLLVTEINVVGLTWSLSSIWFNAARKYFIAGDGIYYKKTLNESWVKDLTFIQIYKDRIRGTQLNNILVSGSNGLISHFNGVNWKHYINNELPYYSGRLLSCDVKDNILIAVGWKEIQAIITMGKK